MPGVENDFRSTETGVVGEGGGYDLKRRKGLT